MYSIGVWNGRSSFPADDGSRESCVTRLQPCVLWYTSRRRHTRSLCDWSSDVCSSDLFGIRQLAAKKRLIARVSTRYWLDHSARRVDCDNRDKLGYARFHMQGRIWTVPNQITLLRDRKSTRLNSSHTVISYAVFCLKKK